MSPRPLLATLTAALALLLAPAAGAQGAVVTIEAEKAAGEGCWGSVGDGAYGGLSFSGGVTRECGTPDRPLAFRLPAGTWEWELIGLRNASDVTDWRWSTDGGGSWTTIHDGMLGGAHHIGVMATGAAGPATRELRVEYLAGDGWLVVDALRLTGTPDPVAELVVEAEEAGAAGCWPFVPDGAYGGLTFSSGFVRECGTPGVPLRFAFPAGTAGRAWELAGLRHGVSARQWRYSVDGGVTWTEVDDPAAERNEMGVVAAGTVAPGGGELLVEYVSGPGWVVLDALRLPAAGGVVDSTPPQVALSCPATVLAGAPATGTWTASDAGSGIAGPDGGTVALDTGTAGARTASSPEVRDQAGNAATATCGYTVLYDWRGFAKGSRQARAGAVVEVGFDLGGDHGAAVLAAVPVSRAVDCRSGAPLGGPGEARGDAVAAYDAKRNGYAFAWPTDPAWRGCRELELALADGTRHTIVLRLR